MKKVLIAMFAFGLSHEVWASQVRFESLQRARTTKQDFVEMFNQPSVMWSGDIKDQVLFESQTGGFLMSADEESKYGIYLGRSVESYSTAAGLIGVTSSLPNALNVIYGRDMGNLKFGLNLFYAAGKTDSPQEEKNFAGLAFGFDRGVWRADLALGLSGVVKAGTSEAKATTSYRVQVEYDVMSDLRAYVDISQLDVSQIGGSSKDNRSIQTLGIERRKSKEEKVFFYGLRYTQSVSDAAIKKETKILPLYAGVEAEATSWLVVRASVTQSLLINEEKLGGNTNIANPNPTYAAGAGIRLGEFLLDGYTAYGGIPNITGGPFPSTPNLNSVELMTGLALTYHF